MTGKKQMGQKCGQPWENRGWKIIYLNKIPHPQVQPQFSVLLIKPVASTKFMAILFF